MRRRELLFSASLLPLSSLFGCGSSGGSEPAAADSSPTVLAMQSDGPHVSVAVTINGRPLRMLLDTGADQNTLTPRAVQTLGLTPSTEGVPSSGASGSTGLVSWVSLDTLDAQGAVLRNSLAYVVPVPEEFSYDGILGSAFFKRFTPSFDYAAQRLTLIAAERFVAPTGIAALPMQVLASGKLLVQATVAGQTGWFSIDTGASNALTIFTPTVERLALRHTVQPLLRMATGLSTSGVAYGDIGRLPQLQLGPWRFENVLAELSLAREGLFGSDAWMGNLGGELWRRFTVTPDLAGGRLYLQPNTALAQPFAGPRSGLAAQQLNSRLVVIDVLPGGPAAQAGVQAGDTVLSLGLPAQAATARTLRQALNQPPGSRVTLGLAAADGSQREATLQLRELV